MVEPFKRMLIINEETKQLYVSDALILLLRDFGSSYLGISSKLYGYQAVGKPIICCADGQPAEYVKETNSGIVVKPGDYEALAKAILYFYHNREAAECFGKAGKRFVEENLSLDKIGSRMMRVFKRAIRNPSRLNKTKQQVV